MKVVIIGSAHPLRGGGIASFNERLARQFQAENDDVTIYTFSLQYPGFLFPGTTQYSTEPAPADLNIKVRINSVNPFNWWRVGRELKKLNPDIIVVRYWIPLMGPCLGTILRIVRKNKHTKIVCIADNVLPHEKRPGDKPFTQYFVKPIDAFITMSASVMKDLRLFTNSPAALVPHPLYDNFGEILDKSAAREHLKLDPNARIILFFGFIRKYKGLDILLDAMKILRNQPENADIKLLIAGEYYGNQEVYEAQIKELGIADQLLLHTHFIADSEVKYYLSAADFVIQPYRDATQSGVTPLAYHFEKPMLVTNVGALAELVPDGKVGVVATPDAASIAVHIAELYRNGESHYIPNLRAEKPKYSWHSLVKSIRQLTGL